MRDYWIYLALMAGITYLLRAIPFVAVQKKIENRFVRSFLYYIPYAVLTAMTIPAVFMATGNVVAAAVGFGVAVALALWKGNLTLVAVAACAAVYLTDLVMIL